MTTLGTDSEGNTPLSPEELGDLIPSLATKEELNEWERENNLQARAWAIEGGIALAAGSKCGHFFRAFFSMRLVSSSILSSIHFARAKVNGWLLRHGVKTQSLLTVR